MASKGRTACRILGSSGGKGTSWFQTRIQVEAKPRGVHIITNVLHDIPELKSFKIGLMNVLLQHTSASISLNECWDSSVRADMEMLMNKLVPENHPYSHTLEGPDDMPAHAKCSLMGSTVTIPVSNGNLELGTWQGLWLCEHRDKAGPRTLVVTITGCSE